MSGFTQKFHITPDLLPTHTRRRPGVNLSPGVRFVVAHDTGNPTSTARANVRHYQSTANLKLVNGIDQWYEITEVEFLWSGVALQIAALRVLSTDPP